MCDNNHPNDSAFNNPFDQVPIAYSYTRKQALADGFQVDVSEIAKEAGFRFPVFITSTAWERYVRVPDGITDQDEKGRLFDILSMLRFQIRKSEAGNIVHFQLHVRNDSRCGTPPLVTLKSVCGPLDIDDPAPSITILLPDED
jgi:hypothetical protein